MSGMEAYGQEQRQDVQAGGLLEYLATIVFPFHGGGGGGDGMG